MLSLLRKAPGRRWLAFSAGSLCLLGLGYQIAVWVGQTGAVIVAGADTWLTAVTQVATTALTVAVAAWVIPQRERHQARLDRVNQRHERALEEALDRLEIDPIRGMISELAFFMFVADHRDPNSLPFRDQLDSVRDSFAPTLKLGAELQRLGRRSALRELTSAGDALIAHGQGLADWHALALSDGAPWLPDTSGRFRASHPVSMPDAALRRSPISYSDLRDLLLRELDNCGGD